MISKQIGLQLSGLCRISSDDVLDGRIILLPQEIVAFVLERVVGASENQRLRSLAFQIATVHDCLVA